MTGKPFNVVLTEEQRAKLEAIRAQMGLRSQADVIRYWIQRDGAFADRFFAEREASIRAGARGIRRKKEPKT